MFFSAKKRKENKETEVKRSMTVGCDIYLLT